MNRVEHSKIGLNRTRPFMGISFPLCLMMEQLNLLLCSVSYDSGDRTLFSGVV